MKLPETFVVRIYRRGHAGIDSLAGVVETVRGEWFHKFASFDELRAILATGKSGSRRGKKLSVSPDK